MSFDCHQSCSSVRFLVVWAVVHEKLIDELAQSTARAIASRVCGGWNPTGFGIFDTK